MKDYFGYSGKKCIVTGAASGMGKATCEMLLEMGAEVYALDILDIDLPVKQSLLVNIGNKASIDNAFKELPDKFDKFFGIAGVSGVKTDFQTTVTINFIGNKYITEQYLSSRVSPGGAIAFMGSLGGTGWKETIKDYKDIVEAATWHEAVSQLEIVAKRVSQKGYGKTEGLQGYFMSKRMLTYYVGKIVHHFIVKDIRVNIICPGSTQTKLTSEWASLLSPQQMQKKDGFQTRYAQPSEMAGPIVFANSDLASYMSGAEIYVDYGQKAASDYKNPHKKYDLISL
jgi:NAD(P)-dependent dehydrogenase (short-subunit alcohol dehydrogenase family)